jgi:pimeloyl-ACP methyl ester carboxylesterase
VVRRERYDVHKLIFDAEPGITVPALLFTASPAAANAPTVVYVNGDGMAADAGVGGPIEALVKSGAKVLALDPRGIGETAPAKVAPGVAAYLSADYNAAYVGIHLSRPLLGQRVYDVLRVIAAQRADAEIHLIGIGAAGPVALHAAALEPRVKRLTLDRSLVSWSAVARAGVSRNQLTNVVPGALAVYDLPELIESIAPRAVVVKSPVDASGAPLESVKP